MIRVVYTREDGVEVTLYLMGPSKEARGVEEKLVGTLKRAGLEEQYRREI